MTRDELATEIMRRIMEHTASGSTEVSELAYGIVDLVINEGGSDDVVTKETYRGELTRLRMQLAELREILEEARDNLECSEHRSDIRVASKITRFLAENVSDS